MNTKNFKLLVVTLAVFLFADAVYAWSGPPAGTPPTCPAGQPGCDAPLNVGGTFQSKDGNLMVNAAGTYATGFSVPYGNVGIGTTGPLNKLSVNGNAHFGTGTDYAYVGNAIYGALEFPRGEIMFSNTNTQNQLFLMSNAYLSNAYLNVNAYNYRNTAVAAGIGIDNGAISFFTDASGTADTAVPMSTRVYIKNDGNVGIGTAVPAYKLDIVGSAWNNIERLYSTGGSSGIDFWDSNGTRRGVVYSDGSGFGLLTSGTGWALQIPYGTADVKVTGTAYANGYPLCQSNGTNCPGSSVATSITNDSYNMKFHWAGQSGQPTWLWGSNNGADSYVWNPSNFSVNYANSASIVTGSGYYYGGGSTYGFIASNVYADTISTGVSGDPLEINYYRAGDMRMYNGDITMQYGHYLYPGSNSGLGDFQKSYYLSSNASWGLYTNTSMYAAGGFYAPAFYYSSDRSLKTDIQTIPNALESVLSLRGVQFNWKKDGTPSLGVIAQEVEKVYPELVSTNAATGLKSVEYGNLVGPLIEAIKEQQKEIESLQAAVQALRQK